MLAKAVVEDLAESKVTVFLFVNNIEGHNLRSVDCQKLLSDLAALPNVYLVATVDNLAAMALLWDRRLATKLSFHHLHVPTYCSYEDELVSLATRTNASIPVSGIAGHCCFLTSCLCLLHLFVPFSSASRCTRTRLPSRRRMAEGSKRRPSS